MNRFFTIGSGLLLLLAPAAPAQNVFPSNPQWAVVNGDASVLQLSGDVLRLDARKSLSGVTVKTCDVEIKAQQNYRFETQVHRLQGDMPFRLNLQWMDKAGRVLGEEYNLMGKLVGSDWEPYAIEAIAPVKAAKARVFVNLPGGWGTEFKNFQLLEANPVGLRVAADLYAAQARAGAWPLVVRIENRGDATLQSAEVEVILPKGIRTKDRLVYRIGTLAYDGLFRRELALTGLPENPSAQLRCKVSAVVDGQRIATESSTPAFISVANEIPITTVSLPAPVLPPSDLQLGCFYFPVMLDWDRNNWGVRPVDYLDPLLGYYNEALPEVADWHIYWAVTHGIQFFVFDWYWNQGMDFLSDALERGFLQSRFKDKMKFCIDWCSEGHATQYKMEDMSTPSMLAFMKVLCERYFIHDNYLTVDGKPVVFLHTPTKLVNAQGGWDGCRAVLDEMRALARSYGHKGVYFVAVFSNTPFLLDFQKGGFDATAPYAYGFRDVAHQQDERGIFLDYETTIPRHDESFATAQKEAHARGLDYIPTAWVGWDDYARSRTTSVRTPGNTPAAFRHMLEMLPNYVEADHKLALIEAWNEWGEGGEIEPGSQYRFGRLSAVRDVLTQARGPYDVFVPTPAEVARFDTNVNMDDVYEIYEKRYGAQFDFSKGLNLDFEQGRQSLYLQPVEGVRDLEITNGVLSADLVTPNAMLVSPPYLGLPAATVTGIEIRMKLAAGSKARLYWSTDEHPDWSENCAKHFPVEADGQFHTYTVALGGEPGWKGLVRQFRFHPSDQTGLISIDYFKTCKESD
ncbi:MAG: glycoside hydrolase family 99-like domain-containing protein [Kiritimatiellales bacterium]|nr:glycoside hydrolase family 99-like domain-containing protein [Kiritimatiellales bacterium]